MQERKRPTSDKSKKDKKQKKAKKEKKRQDDDRGVAKRFRTDGGLQHSKTKLLEITNLSE